jgi:secondary thiamine-phosphate synthase enzyme
MPFAVRAGGVRGRSPRSRPPERGPDAALPRGARPPLRALVSFIPRPPPPPASPPPQVKQYTLTLPAAKRGCHLVTRYIKEVAGAGIKRCTAGTAHVFIQHTSASLTLNENDDPDVRVDMETFLNLAVPEGRAAPWVHTDEGDDDMPAHCKASLLGASVTVPVTRGALALGTWQGVWLCEHRDRGTPRSLVVTLTGEFDAGG